MPSISQVVYCVSRRGLAFTLPCLSNTESSYVRSQCQILTENCPTPADNQHYRFTAIAESYGLQSGRAFRKICERATHEKRFYNKIDMVRPHHVQRGLEFGALLGDPQIWLNNATQKTTNYHFKKILDQIQSSSEYDFLPKYRSRLCQIMEKLGLHDQELDLDTWPSTDYNTFSSEFYDKFLWQACGVNVQDQNKIMKKWRYGKSLQLDKDPINLVRTYFIFKDFFDVNLDMSLSHVALLGRVSALEILVTMNVLYSLTDVQLPEEKRKEKVLGIDLLEPMYVESQIIWKISLTRSSEILLSIGFTQDEITKLTFEFQPYFISDILKKVVDYDNDLERYVDIMKKRLDLLRREGFKLGIADITGIYKFLNNWEQVMDAMDKAEMKRDGLCVVKFTPMSQSPMRHQNQRIRIGEIPFRSKARALPRQYLLQYLEIKEKEDVREFDKVFKRIPSAKDVPLKIIIDSLQYLETLGFRKDQIKEAFHIAFYHRDLLEKEIERVESNLGREWMEKDNALSLLNYYIEVNHGFSFEQIYQGVVDHFHKGFSLPEFKELKML